MGQTTTALRRPRSESPAGLKWSQQTRQKVSRTWNVNAGLPPKFLTHLSCLLSGTWSQRPAPPPPPAHPAWLCVPPERSRERGSKRSRVKRQRLQRPLPLESETKCDSSASEAGAACVLPEQSPHPQEMTSRLVCRATAQRREPTTRHGAFLWEKQIRCDSV